MKNSIDLVRQLVNDFKTHEATYLRSDYPEQRVREDFINKFFIALGWDVSHDQQKNPYEQEVKIEPPVRTGKSQRRADYAFFIGPNFRDPKFFVEAKKPSRSLANPGDYYQIIRYAYNKKIPISVLTDFEEFHIIDCRFMPDMNTALDRRIANFHYSEYADEEKFSLIFHLFGREAVAAGSIEKRAAELPKPKGKSAQALSFKGANLPIDEAFLEKLDDIRLTLAKSFKKHNQHLESEELTEAVQRTIDRLVFIRFLEDKNIEESHIANLTPSLSFQRRGSKGEVGESAWKSFVALCRSLEPKYNGLVFKRHSLIDEDKFVPPEEEFAEICNELSDPNSIYLFDEIPISILGSIYERFLGKVVHATPKRADVEDKPEVRKAGGVYYTPEYIVRYIVQNTVGKLLRGEVNPPAQGATPFTKGGGEAGGFGKTPEEISQMAFADIACGSGSFLIEVYSELLDYHTRYYSAHPEKAKPGDTQMREGKVVLSLKKRQEILTNNIYGVDIDYQATEVTQLSLYLKLLEDVTMNDAYQFGLIKEKILPDLKQNIVCGNSLIGTDILEGDLFEKTEERKLNPMNFADAFPKVMKRGGFDAIVGNPPWIDIKGMNPIEVDYYFKKYSAVENRMNVYAVFLQLGLSLVKKGNGKFGYITPSSFTTQSSYAKLRSLILLNYSFDKIVRLPDNVFKNVVAETTIAILNAEKKKVNSVEILVFDSKSKIDKIEANDTLLHHWVNQENWEQANDTVISLFVGEKEKNLTNKIEKTSTSLINFVDFSLGLTPYDKYKGHTKDQITNRVFHSDQKKNKTFRPLLSGENITRYSIKWDGKEWISYGKWLGAPRDERFFTAERIVVRQIVSGNPLKIYAGYTKEELYNTQIAFNLVMGEPSLVSIKYILALLNSSLINWFHTNRYLDQTKNVFQKILIENAKNFPIRTINFSDPADKSRHDHIVKLVEQMLSAKEKLASAKLESEKDRLELLCSSLDRQIDEAVYELYGLTAEEIKVVEG